jgi:hypothetical protein
MKTYTAYVYTDANYASTAIEADTPEQALELARAMNEQGEIEHFRHYDEAPPVNQIEIFDDEHNELAEWQDSELRLRLVAVDMLALLKRINEAFYVKGTRKALLPVVKETKPLIARAEGREP